MGEAKPHDELFLSFQPSMADSDKVFNAMKHILAGVTPFHKLVPQHSIS
jgi:hypothetical protein